MIEVTDRRSFVWRLQFLYYALGAAWFIADETPHELRNYRSIPLPVFTDWWA